MFHLLLTFWGPIMDGDINRTFTACPKRPNCLPAPRWSVTSHIYIYIALHLRHIAFTYSYIYITLHFHHSNSILYRVHLHLHLQVSHLKLFSFARALLHYLLYNVRCCWHLLLHFIILTFYCIALCFVLVVSGAPLSVIYGSPSPLGL